MKKMMKEMKKVRKSKIMKETNTNNEDDVSITQPTVIEKLKKFIFSTHFTIHFNASCEGRLIIH